MYQDVPLWFGLFALFIGAASLLARCLRWSWAFRQLPAGRYWAPRHVWRYTVPPFLVAGAAVYAHLQGLNG